MNWKPAFGPLDSLSELARTEQRRALLVGSLGGGHTPPNGQGIDRRGRVLAETSYERLKRLLAELFMFDRADLDFGIYRIMNLRRSEIQRFLDEELLPQVRHVLGQVTDGERQALADQIREAEAQAEELGVPPDAVPKMLKVRELRAKHEALSDSASAEDEVYNHLVSFFRRYYLDGDFISQRRYKGGRVCHPL